MRPLDPPLGLTGVGTDNLDVELCQRPAELGHAITSGRLRLVDPEDGMLVGVKGDRLAVRLEIAPEHLKVRKGAFRRHEAQGHQAAGGIVHEHQKRAGWAAILEPAVLATIDLDQLAQMLAAVARLVKALALGARQPQPGLDHPGPQRLTGDPQSVALLELLGRQRWAEIRIMLPHQADGMVPQDLWQTIVGGAAAPAVGDPGWTVFAKAALQAVDLTLADPQQFGGRRWRETAAVQARQNIDPVEFSFAHQHHAHQICRLRSLIPEGRRLTF